MNLRLLPRLAPSSLRRPSSLRCAVCHSAVGSASGRRSERHAECRIDLVLSFTPWNDEGRPVGINSPRPGSRQDLLPLAALALALLMVSGALGVRVWLDGRNASSPPSARSTPT